MKINTFKNIQKKNKKICSQKIYFDELKNNLLLHKIEIKNMQANIQNLSKKINYLKLYINRMLGIQKPPHY
ncbi:hypothetical protein D9V63_02690 [Buchnera aphidicola (Aphis nasturtii)]|uniref:hypothetical protein n=1 Tax=Buchnera aphidicola TaxID=9 RepID=UPI0010C254D4|nr:hypothetical protein [Buchnera aphidicola]QCI18485.1 hypothetical protein D9V63_02690 [Buchnera aphidicola (Aphis nasturtii)]